MGPAVQLNRRSRAPFAPPRALGDDCHIFGIETAIQHAGAVVVPTGHHLRAGVPILYATAFLFGVDAAAVRAHDAFDVLSGRVLGQHDQVALGGSRRDAGDGPHLRIRQAAGRERLANQFEALERVRDADLVTRRAQIEAAVPIEPVRHREAAP
jgi:hypothetical protein